MGARMQEVVVENFKSYEGRVRVGPFRKFTCVVGPNGAGKSNLMDAISFVLGVRGRHLRSERLVDLIHRKDGEPPEENTRVASVELTYRRIGPGGSEEDTLFRREIHPQSPTPSHFQVNGQVLSEAEYLQQLEAINILSKARNFLVFQGDVESASQRQGKELTHFIEQVSGSLAYRDEYEVLAKEKAQKEDLARLLYTKRRNAVNEKKRVGQQSAEAQRYRALEAERRKVQLEFYLFQFHCIAWQAEDAGRRVDGAQQKLEELRSACSQMERRLESTEQNRSALRLQVSKAARDQADAREKLERGTEGNISVRSRLDHAERRLKELREQSGKDAARLRELEQQRAELEAGVQEQQAKIDGFRDKASQKPLFNEDQQERFRRAQSAAERVTSVDSQRARELEAQVLAAAKERARLESEAQEAQAQCRSLSARIESIGEVEATTNADRTRRQADMDQVGRRLRELTGGSEGIKEEKEQLMKQRQEIFHKIQNITAQERQIQQEQRLKRVSGELSQLLPGVRGRILELCQPLDASFHVAMNVALGGYVDAVVTDTRESAKRCIQCLKERMLDPMTFLPLDNLRGQPPNPILLEALRSRSGLWPALRCIKSSDGCDRAFEFLLGDVVFASDLAEGRRFVFGELRDKGIGCRLVTLQGETISRDGNMGINAEAARKGATRFDFQDLAARKDELDKIDKRLQALHAKETTEGSNRRQLEEEKRRLQAKLQESEASLERLRNEKKVQQERLQAEKQKEEAAIPQAQRQSEEEARLREEHRALEAQIDQTVASHFRALSEELDVPDVRTREREWRQERERALVGEREASQRLGSLQAELRMIEQSVREKGAQGAAKAAARCEQEIEQLKGQQGERNRVQDTAQERMEAQDKQLSDFLAEESKCEKEVSVLRRQARDAREALAAAEQQAAALSASQRALRDRRRDLLRGSVLEDVELPTRGGPLQALRDAVAASPAPGHQPAALAADPTDEVDVDLDTLPENKRAVTSDPGATLIEGEYRDELKRLASELAKLRPNLRAGDQLPDVEERADGVAKEAAAAHREVENVDFRFEAVRKARRDLFMDCFKKVAEEISNVYRTLTSAGSGPEQDGGSAYLDLEDLENPFNGAVKFSARPPAKRFGDVSLLSGGERTLAAMALLFALQAYQRPPFLVLDEIDAYLDPRNVMALSRYMQQVECQTIVISLKDKLFSRGQGLVGISKDRRVGSSVVLTLDLDRIRQETAQQAASAPLPPPPSGAP